MASAVLLELNKHVDFSPGGRSFDSDRHFF